MTDSPTESDLQRNVSDLLVRYATGIDGKDWPLFRTCFTEDCHADYSEIGVWDGVDAITDFMIGIHPANIQSLHRITNVVLARDGETLRSRSYVDVTYVGADTGSGMHSAGTYSDHLVHTTDGWRIARRRYTKVHLSPIRGS